MKRVYRLVSLILIAFMMMPAPFAAQAAGTVSFAADEIVSESAVTSAPVDLSDVNEDTAATDELLVLVESGTTKRETSKIADESGASLENISELNDGSKLARVSLDDPEDMQEVADNLASEDCVVVVQPNYLYSAYEDDAVTAAAGEDGDDGETPAEAEEEQENGGDPAETVPEQPAEADAEEPEEAAVQAEEAEEPPASDEDGGYDLENAEGESSEDFNDYASQQWYLKSPAETIGGMDVAGETGAWSLLSQDGKKIRVAVIDSGVDLDHKDFEGVILTGLCGTYNYGGDSGRPQSFTYGDKSNDDDGHGTHVCGIIAAKAGDAYGISGIAYNRAELIVIDAMLPNGKYTTQDIVLSINYAVKNNAKLINLSLGGLYRDFLMEKAINDAYDEGALCICASGNEGSSLPQSPGDTACAVSVMSHDRKGIKADDSNHGFEKDVSAPGEMIYSTYIGDKPWKTVSGTSMAAPMVTGLAVLLLSENEKLSPRQLKNLIYTSSGSGTFNGSTDAFGRINAKTALENAKRLKTEAAEPKNIVLNRDSASMYPEESVSMYSGETVNLEYAIYPGAASEHAGSVTFESSDEDVATVDKNGRVSAMAPGEAVISVSCKGRTAECVISVAAAENEKAVLPFSIEGKLSPSDPKVIITTRTTNGSRTWESYTDGYELELVRGQTIGISIDPSKKDRSTIIPAVRITDPEGKVKMLKRGKSKTTLEASFDAEMKGTYLLQVLGETMGGADEEKPYRLDIEDISEASLSGVANKTYTGSAVKQTLTVKYGKAVLADGTDYKVTYKSNKNVGTATVTVTGTGDYGFSLSQTFRVLPKGTKISKLSRAKKAAGVRWKKQTARMSSSRITGYQIQAATDTDFTKDKKTVTVSGYKKTYKIIKGLKAKKKYYVRVRTYKTVNGTKYYSAWSKARTVKTR